MGAPKRGLQFTIARDHTRSHENNYGSIAAIGTQSSGILNLLDLAEMAFSGVRDLRPAIPLLIFGIVMRVPPRPRLPFGGANMVSNIIGWISLQDGRGMCARLALTGVVVFVLYITVAGAL